MNSNLDIKNEFLQTIEDFKSFDNGNQDLVQFISENTLIFNKRNYILYIETVDNDFNIYEYKFNFNNENLTYVDDINVDELIFPSYITNNVDILHECRLSLSFFISFLFSRNNNQELKNIFIDASLPFKNIDGNILSKDNTVLLFTTQQKQITTNINFNYIQIISKNAIVDRPSITDFIFNSMTQIQKIYNDAFYGCNTLIDISCGNNLEYIGSHAFSRSSIKTVNLSQSKLSSITCNTFTDCESLISIDLPSTMQLIDYNAFNNCSNLQTIHIQTGVQQIIINCNFNGCSNLLSIILNEHNIKDKILSGEQYFCF